MIKLKNKKIKIGISFFFSLFIILFLFCFFLLAKNKVFADFVKAVQNPEIADSIINDVQLKYENDKKSKNGKNKDNKNNKNDKSAKKSQKPDIKIELNPDINTGNDLQIESDPQQEIDDLQIQVEAPQLEDNENSESSNPSNESSANPNNNNSSSSAKPDNEHSNSSSKPSHSGGSVSNADIVQIKPKKVDDNMKTENPNDSSKVLPDVNNKDQNIKLEEVNTQGVKTYG